MSNEFSMDKLTGKLSHQLMLEAMIVSGAQQKAVRRGLIALAVTYVLSVVLSFFLGISWPFLPGFFGIEFILLVALSVYRGTLSLSLGKKARTTLARLKTLKGEMEDEDVKALEDFGTFSTAVKLTEELWMNVRAVLRRLGWTLFVLVIVLIITLLIQAVCWLFS